MTDDRPLISEILAGNQAAYQTFVEKYQRLVAHVVYRMVPNDSDREDICQDVFLKAYSSLGSFQFGCKVSTWLARITHNTCLNYLEKKKVPLLDDMVSDGHGDPWGVVAGDAATPLELVEGQDLSRVVREEINLLPPLYGVLVALFHLEDMPYDQIADVTGMPMGTVKNYLFRARKKLKERITERYRAEEIWR